MKMKKLTALLSTAAIMFGLTPFTMAEEIYEYNAETQTFEIHETVVPGDIKVKEAGADESAYKDSVTVKFEGNKRQFDFKATLDMTPVKEKFDAAVEVITLKGKYDDFKSREVDGQFIVTVMPGNYITIPDADATGTAMYGFTTSSDIYEETAERTIDKDGNLVITVDLKDGVTVEKLAAADSLVDIAYTSADVDVTKAGTIRIKGTVTGWIKTVDLPGEDDYNASATFVAKENNDPVIVGTIKSYTSGGLGGGGGTTTKRATVTFYDGTEEHLKETVNITSGSYVYDTGAVSVPEAEGNKIFTGWYKDAECTEAAATKETITKDTNFYAGWLDTKFDINYNIDGKDVPVNTGATGSVKVGAEDLVVGENEVEVKLSGIEAIGVRITGWYLDPEFTQPAGDSYTVTEDITFYASTKEIETPGPLNDADHFAYIIGYPDGMVRPENHITRQEVATIFFRLLTDEVREANFTSTNNFSDVADGMWSNNAISTMAKMGIVVGYGDNTFKPLNNITRAEFATMAARFTDGEEAESPFSDTEGHWAESYIGIAAALQWVNGSNGMFRPNDYITRAEVMAIVNRVLHRSVSSDYILEDAERWPDNAPTAWYYEDVIEATNSHTYERVAPGQISERWIEITATKDWAALEK